MYSLFVLNFIVLFLMILVGSVIKKHPVSDMNSHNGYNTPTSRKSQEHWDYAQSVAPDIFICFGKISVIAESVLSMLSFIIKAPVFYFIIAGMVLAIIFLCLGFYKTEAKINGKFANN